MKEIISILLGLTVVLGEVPPPYSTLSGFRPNPSLLPSRNQPQSIYGPPPSKLYLPPAPQSQYGVPSVELEPIVSQFASKLVPAKLTIEQLISLTEKVSSSLKSNAASKFRILSGGAQSQVVPQTTYGVPNKQAVPQETYGVPSKLSSSFAPNRNQIQLRTQVSSSAFAQRNHPQTVSLQSQFSSSAVSQPQNTYGAPNQVQRIPQTTYVVPNQVQRVPQTIYGVPNEVQSVPQTTYGVPSTGPANFGVQRVPQSEYGAPGTKGIETFDQIRNANFGNGLQQHENINNDGLSAQYLPVKDASNFNSGFQQPLNQFVQNPSNFRASVNVQAPQNQYLAPSNVQNGNVPQNSYSTSPNTQNGNVLLPQNKYSAPSNIQPQNPYLASQNGNVQRPQNEYITPTNFQNNGQFAPNNQINPVDVRNLRQNNFGRQSSNVDVQKGTVAQIYLNPVQGRGNLQGQNQSGNVNEEYLPPSTTPRNANVNPGVAERRPTRRPVVTQRPTQSPEENEEEEEEEESTEVPTTDKGRGPNVSVATAVAGGEGIFYLRQPDGRLQRVIFQRTQEPSDKSTEYTANYHFQNIQAFPNTLYTPLINLG